MDKSTRTNKHRYNISRCVLHGKSGERRRRWLNHRFENKITEREVKGGHELVEKSAIAAQHTTRGDNHHPVPKLFSSL